MSESEFRARPDDDDKSAEAWLALCAQAAVEGDPKRLLELVSKINRLLDARRKRLAAEADGKTLTRRAKDGEPDR